MYCYSFGMSPAIIYGLFDPRDCRLRYVGMTKRALAVRFDAHCRSARDMPQLREWTTELHREGHEPVVRILEYCEVEARYARERHWRDLLRKVGHADLNRHFAEAL